MEKISPPVVVVVKGFFSPPPTLKKNGHWFMTFFRGQLCVCRMMKVYKQVFFCLHGEAVTDRKTGKLQITMMAPVTFCLVLAMCLVPGLERRGIGTCGRKEDPLKERTRDNWQFQDL